MKVGIGVSESDKQPNLSTRGLINALSMEIVDENGNIISNGRLLSVEVDYDSNNNPIYVGEAVTGTATSAALWRIKKITFDSNNNATSVLWAGGSTAMTNVWNNRTSYSYS